MTPSTHKHIYIYMLGRCSPLRSSYLFLKNLMVVGGFGKFWGGSVEKEGTIACKEWDETRKSW